MSRQDEPIPRLGDVFRDVDGLYVNCEYRERPDYRFRHDAKPHRHAALAESARVAAAPAFSLRHWIVQDLFDSEHVNRMLHLARDYGMTGIQFSGDNIYWVTDAPQRYNSYVFAGELCERCHDLGLEAYFWTHEINGSFHEFVRNGRYGFSGQLAGGEIDLSAGSGFWGALYEKYDVFLRRLKGVDGLVLTVNESQVPVFRDRFIRSDLSPDERVATIARTVKNACDTHGKQLVLRTFCYSPEETERIRRGVERLGPGLTLMIKCVPHDWQTFYPHDPLIAALREFPRVVEFDLAHEPMGAGRFPYPDSDHLTYRFAHAAAQGVMGVAGRIDRFRNHAHGTLNWANVYAFSQLAHTPAVPADTLWRDYAAADFGAGEAAFITDLGRRLFAVGQQTFFLGKEWGSAHSNLNTFDTLDHGRHWSRSLWAPEDTEAAATLELLCSPTPEFIARIADEKAAALADVRRLRLETDQRRATLAAADFEYLMTVLRRSAVICEALTTQQVVMLMVRFDARRPVAERRFTDVIAASLRRLRNMAIADRQEILDGGNEGCQYGPELLEHFCRNAERHLLAGPSRNQTS